MIYFSSGCLPIYRHLKGKTNKERNKCSLKVARFSAQNMAEKSGTKNEEKPAAKGEPLPLVADKATWGWTPTGRGMEMRLRMS